MARALGPHGHLFRARGDVRISGEAKAGAWLEAISKFLAEREVAQVCAVIGRSFWYPLIREVAGIEEPALQIALKRLAEADILLVQRPVAAI